MNDEMESELLYNTSEDIDEMFLEHEELRMMTDEIIVDNSIKKV